MRLIYEMNGCRARKCALLTLIFAGAFFGLSASSKGVAANSLRADMPTPPPPSEDGGPASQFRYDKRRSSSANAAIRKALVKKVELWTHKLKDLDQRTQKRPRESISSAVGVPTPDREELVNRIAAWNQQLSFFDLESICGPVDNSQDVELYNGALGPTIAFVKSVQPSTVQIQWNDDLAARFSGPGDDAGNVNGVRWCSGTLIDSNHVLTAGHCFEKDLNGWRTPARGSAGGPSKLTAAELAPLMHVNFNYQLSAVTHSPREATVYPIARLVEFERGNFDYAVIELGSDAQGKSAGGQFNPLPLDASDAELQNASVLTVVQHPNGEPKKVSAGSKISVVPTLISYSDVDTLGGSSGAGIVDQNGKLIGIHTNGGCTARGTGANSGIPLAAVRNVSSIIK